MKKRGPTKADLERYLQEAARTIHFIMLRRTYEDGQTEHICGACLATWPAHTLNPDFGHHSGDWDSVEHKAYCWGATFLRKIKKEFITSDPSHEWQIALLSEAEYEARHPGYQERVRALKREALAELAAKRLTAETEGEPGHE